MSIWRTRPLQFGARGFAMMIPREPLGLVPALVPAQSTRSESRSQAVQPRRPPPFLWQSQRCRISTQPFPATTAPATPENSDEPSSSQSQSQPLSQPRLQSPSQPPRPPLPKSQRVTSARFRRSALVKVPANSPSLGERKRSKHKYRKDIVRQRLFAQVGAALDREAPDWRKILQTLAAKTPSRSSWRGVVIDTDPSKFDPLLLLSKGLPSSLRSISRRTGSAVWASWRDEEHRPEISREVSRETFRDGKAEKNCRSSALSVVVYGPPESLDVPVNAVLETAGVATVVKAPTRTGFEAEIEAMDDSMIRFLAPRDLAAPATAANLDVEAWTDPSEADIYRTETSPKVPLSKIRLPAEWTYDTFDHFVRDVIRSVPVPGEQTSGAPSHAHQVASLLAKIFADPATHRVATPTSCQRAFHFLATHGITLLPELEAFFAAVKKNPQMPVGPDAFNAMLRAAAHAKDLSRFYVMLLLMVGAGHSPNFHTWLIFMYMVEDHSVRRQIMKAMASKGMLSSPTAARRIAGLLAPQDFERAMGEGARLGKILDKMDKAYTSRSRWLTRVSGNKIIDILGTHGRHEDALALVDEMAKPGRPLGMRPDVVTYNTILTHAKVQQLVSLSLTALQGLEHSGFNADDITFDALFDLFWRRRMPLCLAVVWHFAVLNKATSYRMRRRVVKAVKARKCKIPRAEANFVLAEWAVDQRRNYRVVSALYPEIAPHVQPAPENMPTHVWKKRIEEPRAGLTPVSSLSVVLESAINLDRKKLAEIRAWVPAPEDLDGAVSKDADSPIEDTGDTPNHERDHPAPGPSESLNTATTDEQSTSRELAITHKALGGSDVAEHASPTARGDNAAEQDPGPPPQHGAEDNGDAPRNQQRARSTSSEDTHASRRWPSPFLDEPFVIDLKRKPSFTKAIPPSRLKIVLKPNYMPFIQRQIRRHTEARENGGPSKKASNKQ